MPGKIRIVTDSSAQFIDTSLIERYEITVVPLRVQIGGQIFQEGLDLEPETFFRKLSDGKTMPVLLPPDLDELSHTYARLNKETDQILSLHLSRKMHSTWEQARLATQSLLGRCEIAVLDSQTISVGLAYIVEEAAKMAENTRNLDDVVREVRAMVERVYSIFYVDSLDYLQRGGLISESQSILGAMLGVKPFLTIEGGDLITMEKVRTRSQAVDKLVEFVTEFADVEQMAILQNSSQITEQTRMLRERLNLEFSQRTFPVTMYKPSLGAFIGPDGTGIMVFESEIEDLDTGDDLS